MADFYSDIPELDAERAGILKRRKIAEMLQQQSMKPLESQQAGAYVVPTSPLLGIGKVLEAYLGKRASDEADLAQANLGQKAQGMLSAEKQKVADAVLAQQEMPRPSSTMEGPMPGQDPTLDTQRNRLIGLNPKFDQAEKDREERLKLIEQTIAREDAQEQQRQLRKAMIDAAKAGKDTRPFAVSQARIIDTNPKSEHFGKSIIVDANTRRFIGVDSGLDTGAQGAAAKSKTAGRGEGEAITSEKASAVGANKALSEMGFDPVTGKDRVTDLLKKATGGIVGASKDALLGAFNYTTEGKKANADLAATANTVVMNMMGGKLGSGISNADRDFVTGQLGIVGDANEPTEARLAAWTSAKERLIQRGAKFTDTGSGLVGAGEGIPQRPAKRIKFDANGNMVQ